MNFLRVRPFALHGLLFEGENVDLLTKLAKVYCFRRVSSVHLRAILIAQEEVLKPEPRLRDNYDLTSMARFFLENPNEPLVNRLANFQEIDWVILQHITEVVDAALRQDIIVAASFLIENNFYAQLFLLSQPEALLREHIEVMVVSKDPLVLLGLLSRVPNLTLAPEQLCIVINNLALLGIFDSLAALDEEARITLLNNLVRQQNVTGIIMSQLDNNSSELNALMCLLSNTEQLREDFSLSEDSSILSKLGKIHKKHQDHRRESLLSQILGFGGRVPVEHHTNDITEFLSTIVTHLMSEIKTRAQIEEAINQIDDPVKKGEYAKEIAEKVGTMASWIVRVPRVLDKLVTDQPANAEQVAQALDGSWQGLSIDFYLALFGALWNSNKERIVTEASLRWVVDRDFFSQLHFLNNDISKSWSVLKIILNAGDPLVVDHLFQKNRLFTVEKRNSDPRQLVFPLFRVITLYSPVNEEEKQLISLYVKTMLQEMSFDIQYYLSEAERSMSFQVSSAHEQQQHNIRCYESSDFFRELPIVQQARRFRALITGENLIDGDTQVQSIVDQELLAFDLQYRYSGQLLNFIYSLYSDPVFKNLLTPVWFDEDVSITKKTQTYYQKMLSSLEAVQVLQSQQWVPSENPKYYKYEIDECTRKRIKRMRDCIKTLPVEQVVNSPSMAMFLFVSHIEALKHELNKDKKVEEGSKRHARILFLEYVAFAILDYTALVCTLENANSLIPDFLNLVFMLCMSDTPQSVGLKQLITHEKFEGKMTGLQAFFQSADAGVQAWLRNVVFSLDGRHKKQVNDVCFALALLPQDLLEAVFGKYTISVESGVIMFKKTEEKRFVDWISSRAIDALRKDERIDKANLDLEFAPREAIFSVSLRRRESTVGSDEDSRHDSMYSTSSSTMYSGVNPMKGDREQYKNSPT